MQIAVTGRQLVKVIHDAQALVEDIRTHAEGLDPALLLEAVFLDDSDFSEPLDPQAFLASLRQDGLL